MVGCCGRFIVYTYIPLTSSYFIECILISIAEKNNSLTISRSLLYIVNHRYEDKKQGSTSIGILNILKLQYIM